jgi:hypothetical protein
MSFEHTVQLVDNAPGMKVVILAFSLVYELKETVSLVIVILFIFVLDRSGPQIFRHIRWLSPNVLNLLQFFFLIIWTLWKLNWAILCWIKWCESESQVMYPETAVRLRQKLNSSRLRYALNSLKISRERYLSLSECVLFHRVGSAR